MAKRIVVGNWKGYVESVADAAKFAALLRRAARSFAGVEAWLAPAFPHIPTVAGVLKKSPIKVGAQAVSPHNFAQNKQHTGEVSAQMLKDAGASFSIIGHSERRAWAIPVPLDARPEGFMGETNESVHAQIVQASAAGLTAVLCAGERERTSTTLGVGDHFSFVESQLVSALRGVGELKKIKLAVAYEPVWAIGKEASEACKPADLQEMSIFIRKTLADILGRPRALRVPILYGGSVDQSNAKQLLAEGDIAGFLVGRASADIKQFVEILKSARLRSR